MEAVIYSDFESKLQEYLVRNEANLITYDNIPVLDMGERPSTFDSSKAESMQ